MLEIRAHDMVDMLSEIITYIVLKLKKKLGNMVAVKRYDNANYMTKITRNL